MYGVDRVSPVLQTELMVHLNLLQCMQFTMTADADADSQWAIYDHLLDPYLSTNLCTPCMQNQLLKPVSSCVIDCGVTLLRTCSRTYVMPIGSCCDACPELADMYRPHPSLPVVVSIK
jgi:hypothetical protein